MKKNGVCVILTLILPLKRCGAFGGKQQQKVSFTKRNEEIVMKRFGIAALCAALVVFGLAGCPSGDEAIERPDKPLTPTGWTKGLDSLKVETGDIAGQILYQFEATDPVADTYELYRVKGIKNKAGDIIAGDTAPLDPTVGRQDAITGLDVGETYSIVVVAKATSGRTPAVSAVKQVKAMHEATLLIINNIPYQTIPFFFASASDGMGAAVLGGFLDAAAAYTPQHNWDEIVPQTTDQTKADANLYLYNGAKLMGYALAAQNAAPTALNLRPGNVDKKKLSGTGHLTITVFGAPATGGGTPTSNKTYRTRQTIDLNASTITVDWDTAIEDITPPTP